MEKTLSISQIKEAIFNGLTPRAQPWWNGSSDEVIGSYVILAQRQSIGAAINEFNDSFQDPVLSQWWKYGEKS